VAEEMGYGRTQIMKILFIKMWDFNDFENNVPSSRKRQRRVTGNVNINQLCWDWFQDFFLLNIFIYLFIYLYVLFKSYHIQIIS
jgi:hypothetical protein